MDLIDIRIRRTKLQTEIAALVAPLINEFQSATHIAINDVRINMLNVTAHSDDYPITVVGTVDVELVRI